MHLLQRRAISVSIAVSVASTAALPARGQIPVRPLGAIIARSMTPLGSIAGIRALSDGRVIVNDPNRRRLVMFDQRLTLVATIADTGAPNARLYPAPGRGGGGGSSKVVAYQRDSTLFWDPVSVAFLVIDPAGAINRVVSSPSATLVDAMSLVAPASDARGALVYRKGTPRPAEAIRTTATPAPPPDAPAPGDSSLLIRVDVMSHRVDTIARLAAQRGDIRGVTTEGSGAGNIQIKRTTTYRLSDAGDDWAVTPDGSIAIIRGRDYHIDWINPDGSRSSTPKIEHQWTRLTDDLKQRLVDSLTRVTDSLNATQSALTDAAVTLHYDVVPADDMPDYLAPFRLAATRADAEGNLWICTTPEGPAAPPCIYEIVNPKGVIIDRVRLPGGVTLEGFGPGVAYLSSREGNGVVLAAARIR